MCKAPMPASVLSGLEASRVPVLDLLYPTQSVHDDLHLSVRLLAAQILALQTVQAIFAQPLSVEVQLDFSPTQLRSFGPNRLGIMLG